MNRSCKYCKYSFYQENLFLGTVLICSKDEDEKETKEEGYCESFKVKK